MDRPDPPSVDDAGAIAADGYDDVAVQRRSVAADMDSIFAPLAASAGGVRPPLATPPVGTGRPSARQRIAMIGGTGAAIGLAAAAYVLHPPGLSMGAPSAPAVRGGAAASAPYRAPPPTATPDPALAAAVVTPVPPSRDVSDEPVSTVARKRVVPERPIAAMARVEIVRQPAVRAHRYRGERGCGPNCLRASELTAHRALERAYYAAADAGVSQDELSDYRSDWRRLRRRTARDPRTLIREYDALADELYARALEERSAPH